MNKFIKFYVYLLFVLISHSSFSQENSSINNTIVNSSDARNKSEADSLIFSNEQLDKIINAVKKDNNSFDNALPSIVALIVVIVSTLGAVHIGKEQIKAQSSNTEKQLRSQEAQAQQQFVLAKDQMLESSKAAIAQVRANNVAQARIQWLQELRNLLSNYISEILLLNLKFTEIKELIDSNKDQKAKTLFDLQADSRKTVIETSLKIKLHLNANESKHKKLEDLLDEYEHIALESKKSVVEKDFIKIEQMISSTSKEIIKEAWDQVKDEGQ